MAFYVQRRSQATAAVSHRVQYRPSPGAREKVVTFDDQAEAIKWRDLCNLVGPAEALRALEAAAPETRPTVSAVVAAHLGALSGVEPGTRQDYLRDARLDIDPGIGKVIAADLTRRQVAEWVIDMETRATRPLAPKTIKNRHALLSAALTSAMHEGTLTRNVAKGVPLPEVPDAEMVFLTRGEVDAILDHIGAHWRPLVECLALTGLRWSEATALRVRDIDIAATSLQVMQAWKHLPGQRRMGLTKTRAGRRVVEYGPTARAHFERCVAGRPRDAFVFTNTRGDPVLHETFYGTHWVTAVKAAMAAESPVLTRWARIHDLRHTYASWCLNAGVPIFLVSRVLGHKNASVTTDRYGHLQPDRLGLAAEAAEAALRG